ncbi:MAG: hypothetical protein U0359_33895 [Byssovorax sp.]
MPKTSPPAKRAAAPKKAAAAAPKKAAAAAPKKSAPATSKKSAPAAPKAARPASTPAAAASPGAGQVVDFVTVSTAGFESSPVAAALAGLRANEARYYKNKYDHTFVVHPAAEAQDTIAWIHGILQKERGIVIASRPIEATRFRVANIKMAYVFYESGLSINVMYTVDDAKKRAVGFKLSEGMDVPAELGRFKFARQ